MNKNIFSKNVVFNRIELIVTLSRFNNSFVILCFDDLYSIKFLDIIVKFKHASILKGFNFSDSYLCFLNVDDFISNLSRFFLHLRDSLDGKNLLLAYVHDGMFLNIYNFNLIQNLLANFKYFFDFENLFVQAVVLFIAFLENTVLFLTDSLSLLIDDILIC